MKIQKISFQSNHQYNSLSIEKEVLSAMNLLRDKKAMVGFAESCTGGLLSSEFTKVSGVSSVFVGSVVCYANEVKQTLLNVSSEILKRHGAVSAECAEQMVIGALKNLKCSYAVAITGIAGPNGGTDLKPVGTVFIAVGGMNQATKSFTTQIFQHDFSQTVDDSTREFVQLVRGDIQSIACKAAIGHLNNFLNEVI